MKNDEEEFPFGEEVIVSEGEEIVVYKGYTRKQVIESIQKHLELLKNKNHKIEMVYFQIDYDNERGDFIRFDYEDVI